MVSLQTVTLDDRPLWQEIRVAALTDAPRTFKAQLADWHRGGQAQWRSRLAIPGSYNLVALRGGLPVGMVRGIPGEGETSELRSLWVSPEAQGDGVGDRLIEAVTRWARRSGSITLKLAVIPGNESAIALHQRHGFVTTEELGDLLPDGTREQILAKPLHWLATSHDRVKRSLGSPLHALVPGRSASASRLGQYLRRYLGTYGGCRNVRWWLGRGGGADVCAARGACRVADPVAVPDRA